MNGLYILYVTALFAFGVFLLWDEREVLFSEYADDESEAFKDFS
jgi:hypothetical protein